MIDYEELFQSTLSDLPRSDCNDYYCTTCGGQFAKVQQALSVEDQSSIFEYLKSLSFSDFEDCSYMANRRLYVEHLLLSAKILAPDQAMAILSVWGSKLTTPERLPFSDFILFYFVRDLSRDHPVYREWVDRCTQLVAETDDYSLLESLVLVEGDMLPVSIRDKAVSVAIHDDQMRRAITNAFGYKKAKMLFAGS